MVCVVDPCTGCSQEVCVTVPAECAMRGRLPPRLLRPDDPDLPVGMLRPLRRHCAHEAWSRDRPGLSPSDFLRGSGILQTPADVVKTEGRTFQKVRPSIFVVLAVPGGSESGRIEVGQWPRTVAKRINIDIHALSKREVQVTERPFAVIPQMPPTPQRAAAAAGDEDRQIIGIM